MSTTPAPTPAPTPRYLPPTSWGDRAFMAAVTWLTRHGISLLGSRVLTVRGRRTGAERSVPVNLLEVDGERYLVAPRGNTQWVRNLRAAGEAQLRVGSRVEQVTAVELPVGDRVPVIRVYLKRWGWEVGQFFDGLSARSDDAAIAAVADDFPVFRLSPQG